MSVQSQIPQSGVRVYQFIVDRLDERRRERHPAGREEYEADWLAAHELEQALAEAGHAGDVVMAESLLHHLMDVAAQWQDHPHHPDNDVDDRHELGDVTLGTRP
ncbi:hypothetical protein [Streptomyces sp. NPDC091416]|uniref:hypothetical protein n=1 Tax=Streptomyces sp. NPDC091416 TaxID=3366003 RepID=UPI003828D2F8